MSCHPQRFRNLDDRAQGIQNRDMPNHSRLLVLFCFAMCLAYSQAQVAVTPAKATMLVGESRPFRAVDSQGHMLTNVHWTISTQGLADLAQGAEVEVVAKQPGRFTLTAHVGA